MPVDFKKIAVLYGGMSSEREVSLTSGLAVSAALKKLNINHQLVDVDKDIANKLNQIKPDVAFIALHGTYGEDGCIQGLLDILNIPYTHSNVISSAIAMNKKITNELVKDHDILAPKSEILSATDITNGKVSIEMPYVIKPISEGSSVGVYIINKDTDIPDISEIEKFGDMIVQEYIEGTELACAVIDEKPLGIIEIKTVEGFYNYENKYTEGKHEHIFPAEIDKDSYDYVMKVSHKVHKIIGCSGVSRSDFRFDVKNNKAYFLEINTHPGLTELSLLPEIAANSGLNFDDLIIYLIKNAKCRKNQTQEIVKLEKDAKKVINL